MGRYAEHTRVPVERTKVAIEQCLSRYGADSYFAGWDARLSKEVIGFRWQNLTIRITIELEKEPDAQQRRQRWRALLLVIKAKLEAVSSDISTFEEEFLAWVVTPEGLTIGERLLPQLTAIAESGDLPRLLPGPTTVRESTGA